MTQKLLPLFVLLLSLLLSAPLAAQIRGQVKDTESMRGIPDVHIQIMENKKGTSTAHDGSFMLKRDDFPVRLLLTAVGYRNKIVTVFRSQSDLIIYMDPEMMGLDEIVVSQNRIDNPITQNTTIARSTIDSEQLSDKSLTSAVELLRAETGVFVQQTSVGQGSIYVRGRAGRDVLYLFNGFRMNPSFVRSGQNQYFGSVDPFLISKIDVYRGPVSIYYGSDALSGGVNVEPMVKSYSPEDTLSGEVYSALNFNGNGEKTLHAKAAYQSENFSLMAGGTIRDFDYYRMSEESDQNLWFPYNRNLENADYRFRSFQLSSKIRTGDDSDLTLISYYGEIPSAPRLDRVTMGYAIEEPNPPSTPREAYDSNTEPLLFWGNTIEYQKLIDGAFADNMSLKAGYFRLKDHRKTQGFAWNDEPEYVTGGDNDYTFSRSDTVEYDRNTSNQFLAALDFQSTLNTNLILEWGADFSYDRTESRAFSSAGDQYLPRYPDGSTFLMSGIFMQLDQRVGPQLNLEYGGRLSYTYADIPFEGSGTARPFGNYSDGNAQLTGSFGLSYELNPGLNLISNISSGFRAPNIADLSEVGDRGSNLFQITNTKLRPEKTINYDLGFRQDNGRLSTEMVGYWLHYFDKIDRVETGSIVYENGEFKRRGTYTTDPDEYVEVYNHNANSMDLLGVEFRTDYIFIPEVKSGLTFTYTWGELTNPDGSKEPVNRVPPANGLFYLDYSPADELSIRPQIRYAFAHRRISPDEVDDIRVSKDGTDGFVNLQLYVNYSTAENVHFKFVADNLADTAYREHASSLDGLGRNFTLAVSYRF